MSQKLDQRLERYFSLTGRALKKVKLNKTAKINVETAAKDFLMMAQSYYEDAKHFQKKGDKLTAFAALNYAHGWLDAGARLNLFDVGGDSELFTVDEEWQH